MLKNIKKHSGFVIALSFLVGFSGCGDDSNSNQSVPNQSFNKRGTVQGSIFNATDGKRVGGTDLKVTLVQGSEHRSPTSLITDINSFLLGEYAFTQVPVSLSTGNTTYKLVVNNKDFQQFEGLVALKAAITGNTIDENYNFLGDVYLFPTGATATDITVSVEFNGEPVVGATVLLQQNAVANVPTAEVATTTGGAAPGGTAGGATPPTRLVATPGMLPTLFATTALNANNVAVATFAAAKLVLGGAYTPVVLPTTHEGVPTARTIGAQMLAGVNAGVGTSSNTQVITVADNTSSNQDDGIHVVFASNRDSDDITGLTNPGVLTLVFNRAVALTSTTPFVATLGSAGSSVLGAPTVTAALSSPDGLTLTLTPQFTTAPVAGDTNLFVTFTGGTITVAGDEGDKAVNVFGLNYLDGTLVNAVVNVVGP